MLVVNSQLLQQASDQPGPTGKFLLNDIGIIFFPTSQQHNSVKLHGLSYEDDYRGNALAGIFQPGRIDIRYHAHFSDERVKALWLLVIAQPEISTLGGRQVFYQGRQL